MGSENQFNKGITLANLPYNVLLLHHAAAQSDHHIGVCHFSPFQFPHHAQQTNLCVFSHRAGVVDDNIRLRFLLCPDTAHIHQHAHDFFTVRNISLTAEGFYPRSRYASHSSDQQFSVLRRHFPLTHHFLSGNRGFRFGLRFLTEQTKHSFFKDSQYFSLSVYYTFFLIIRQCRQIFRIIFSDFSF